MWGDLVSENLKEAQTNLGYNARLIRSRCQIGTDCEAFATRPAPKVVLNCIN